MKHPLLNIILLSSIFLTFSQCKKESVDPEEIVGIKRGEIKLSNAELNIVPYQVGDSLNFKDSLGNTQIFIVESRRTHLKRYYKNGGTDSSTDYYDIENLTVSLSSNNNNFFSFSLDAPLPSYVSNNNINKNYFIVRCNLLGSMNYYFFPNYIDTTDFYYTLQGTSIPHHPTFTILNNTFNSVYELTDNSPEKIYYSTSIGVIGFRTEDDTSWYLDN